MTSKQLPGILREQGGGRWQVEEELAPGERLEAARQADRDWRAVREARAEAWLRGILRARASEPRVLMWWSIWSRRMGTVTGLAGFGILILACVHGWVEGLWAGIALMLLCQRGWFIPMAALTPLLVWSARGEAALHRGILRWARRQGLPVEVREPEHRIRRVPGVRYFL